MFVNFQTFSAFSTINKGEKRHERKIQLDFSENTFKMGLAL